MSTSKIIYLDNAATTKVDERVVKAMIPYFSEKYGNASSSHSFGKEAKEAIEKSREIIARSINALPEEIIFTSGGTEANNLALKGLFYSDKGKNKNHIITTKIEHPSILEVCKWLEKHGTKITYLDVDKEGLINIKELEREINNKTLVVSIIQGNNEIGTLQNLEKIGELCKKKGVYFHVDACQSFTKSKIDVKKQNLSLVTINGHKIHGPKGIGALYVRKGINLEPLSNGGGHENGIRSGTENVPAIVGFAEAVKVSSKSDVEYMKKLRDYTINKLINIHGTKINGPMGEKRLCNNINISFGNIEGEAISNHLESYNIMVSTGSACASHSLKKSHVLKAIGLNDFEINSSIRITLSKYTKKEEINRFIKIIKQTIEVLRKISPFKVESNRKLEKINNEK